jgi:hypothetical protein
MSIFFYHLYRKLSREEYRKILALLESGKKETENGDFDLGDFPDQE